MRSILRPNLPTQPQVNQMRRGHETSGWVIFKASFALAVVVTLVTIFLKWATHQ